MMIKLSQNIFLIIRLLILFYLEFNILPNDPIKKNWSCFEIGKLTRHILPSLKPHNFPIQQSFIRRIIEKLLQVRKLRESA